MSERKAKNLVILNGHIALDPQLRYTQTGKPVCSFLLDELDERSKNWIPCVAWEADAEAIKNAGKGAFIEFKARVTVRKYKNNDDKWQTVVEQTVTKIDELRGNGMGTEPDFDSSDDVPF